MKQAVGYVRVSTHHQVKEGESLTTQRKALTDYAKGNKYELIEIYADEGISGGSVEKRPGLQALLQDAQNHGFSIVLVHRLSRLGRNARELLNNVQLLKEAGVSVMFLKENIDLSNAYGNFMLTMLAAMAELEKDISGEASVENKIALAKKGIPSIGKYPFGRRFNRKTGEWYFDPPDIKEVVNDIADRYLNGEGLRDIADTIDPSYQLAHSNIIRVLRTRSGDTWELKFKKEKEPVIFKIPRLMTEAKIAAVKKRMEFNQTYNKATIRRKTFLLTGFARCMECGCSLTAQHQKTKRPNGKTYTYNFYRHRAGSREKCRALSSIKMDKLNKAVLDAIWENLSDEDSGFLEAWADNYPDQDKIDKFRKEVKKNQKKLKRAESDRDKLVEALLSGVLTEEAIKKKNEILSNEIIRLKGKLVKEEQHLSRMPSLEEIKEREEQVKQAFQDFYYSRERFDSMSFEELRGLLFAIFDGKDDEGNPLGVYVKRISPLKTVPARYEYYINARFFAGHIESDPDDGKDDSGADGNGGKEKSPANSKTNLEDKVGKPQPMTYPRVEDVKCGFFDSFANTTIIPEDKSFKTCPRSLYDRFHRQRMCKSPENSRMQKGRGVDHLPGRQNPRIAPATGAILKLSTSRKTWLTIRPLCPLTTANLLKSPFYSSDSSLLQSQLFVLYRNGFSQIFKSLKPIFFGCSLNKNRLEYFYFKVRNQTC